VGGSFKVRGSLSTLLTLNAQGNKKGVITASMGNTATGLAYAGRLLDYPVTVVMPKTVSSTKLEATKRIGAEVILEGGVGDDALEHSVKLAKDRDILFVHPHKTPAFLEGNATIAREIMEENARIEQIFIPIGGGGLASGICQYIQDSGISVTPIGVEAEMAPAFSRSFEQGRPIRLTTMQTIADALTLMEPDPDVFSYLYGTLSKVVTVSEKDIVRAMQILFDEYRVITEPGGAAALAAMLTEKPKTPSVAIISGGNISLEQFQRIVSSI
jgi:threonine dehydratase